MKKIYLLLLFPSLYLCFISCNSPSQLINPNKANTTTKKKDIYLLIGQSNMAGRAAIEAQDKDTLNGVFIFTGLKDKPWEKAANPLNKYSSIRKKLSMQRLSPAYTFGKKMATLKGSNPIGLLVNAKGGTSIDLWAPDSEFYKAAVNRTKAALKYGVLKGIAWHQGESDAKEYDTYLLKMKALIAALRIEFDNPKLPVVVGQISPDKPFRFKFNQMILELPKHVDNVGVVTIENMTTQDSTHFDSASQRLFGERYAIKMQELLLK